MGYICTMKYYSATKKSENLTFSDKWMKPGIIIQIEVTQMQGDKKKLQTLFVVASFEFFRHAPFGIPP